SRRLLDERGGTTAVLRTPAAREQARVAEERAAELGPEVARAGLLDGDLEPPGGGFPSAKHGRRRSEGTRDEAHPSARHDDVALRRERETLVRDRGEVAVVQPLGEIGERAEEADGVHVGATVGRDRARERRHALP